MDSLKKEAENLVIDAKEIADSIDNEGVSLTQCKHSIAIICKRYTWIYAELNKEKERE